MFRWISACLSAACFPTNVLSQLRQRNLPSCPRDIISSTSAFRSAVNKSIRFLIHFVKLRQPAFFIAANPYLFSSSCYRIRGLLYSSIENLQSFSKKYSTSIYLFMFILHNNRADQPELLHDQVISWTKKNVLGPHELWHNEWKEHSWYHTPWCTGCKAASYPSEFPRAF